MGSILYFIDSFHNLMIFEPGVKKKKHYDTYVSSKAFSSCNYIFLE
jgi:hypothetical protein